MRLRFAGAAGTVTGSMHVLTVGGRTVLLDCGTMHGRREEARQVNSRFPFDPRQIDAVVLSHAHIDHSGNLPTLVRQGFRGPVYATGATVSLCQVMLRDSAYIQERDAEFITKKHRQRGLPPVEPLYRREDADRALELFVAQRYGGTFPVAEGIDGRFEDAGHILGSASVALTLREGAHTVRLAFTGDLGRRHLPILRDPVFIGDDGPTDYLLSESTYGGRTHAPVEEMKEQLFGPIRRASDRSGKIIIPAFSVGRTQELVYMLHLLHREGRIDTLPVFVDSPLSVNVTEVFRRHPECFDPETLAILRSPVDNDPFGFERLTYIRTLEESKALNDARGPCIIIAASGMCEAGRITHHLANGIGEARNMVLIVGYQAEHTLGKRLVEREPVVNIFGEPHPLKAEVVVLNSFSGHADGNELAAYIGRFSPGALRGIFLVHGDPDQAGALGAKLRGAGFGPVAIPSRGDEVALA